MTQKVSGSSDSDWLSLAQERVSSNGWCSASSSSEVVEPATGETLGRVGQVNVKEVRAVAQSAASQQTAWAAMSYDQRAEVLRAAAVIAQANRAQITDWLIREGGSIRPKAEFEIDVTIKAIHKAAAMALESTGELLPSTQGRLSIARRMPVGVVGVISPFNFPLYLAMRAVAPALAVGNSVVLKPDLRTAVCGGIVIAKIFELAGLPTGVLHVIPGGRDVGEAMCVDPQIAMIQFTGSTAAGRAVGKLAGGHLKKLSLELGGKNSLIILDDADLDLAVANARWSVYLHQGQICMSAGRILVQERVATEFLKRMSDKARNTSIGDPNTSQVALGPMISEGQVKNALRIINASVAQGAELLAGGTAEGLFLKPTLLSGVKSGMTAYEEEIFGPVAVVSTFSSDEEAARMANDSPFGLSAAIISTAVGRALALGEQLKVGLLHINDQTVNDEVINPFGGTGASGNGTSIGGPSNWELFTHWQWLTIKSTPPAYPL